jgi:hypothetical protein
MPAMLRVLLAASFVWAVPLVHAQVKESKIVDQLKSLRAVAPDQKGAAILRIAADIYTQPPGLQKVKLADNLVHLVTEGDPGPEPLQAAADTLAKALTESPVAPRQR